MRNDSKRHVPPPREPPAPFDSSIQELVSRTIKELLPSDPSIMAVARVLSINVRTLQRRLAQTGSSYRRLLDECRHEQAKAHLLRKDLSVAEVSRRLGYSDPAHFVRAFRRWTGYAPSRFCSGSDAEHKESTGN